MLALRKEHNNLFNVGFLARHVGMPRSAMHRYYGHSADASRFRDGWDCANETPTRLREEALRRICELRPDLWTDPPRQEQPNKEEP